MGGSLQLVSNFRNCQTVDEWALNNWTILQWSNYMFHDCHLYLGFCYLRHISLVFHVSSHANGQTYSLRSKNVIADLRSESSPRPGRR